MEPFEFHIEARYTPETMPLERLVEYLSHLAILFGEERHVHLIRIGDGSTVPALIIDDEAVPGVEKRIFQAQRGEANPAAIRAIRTINYMLQQDEGVGNVVRRGAEIIRFPGREIAARPPLRAYQEDVLDGAVIRVGGKRKRVPVHLQADGQTFICHTSRKIARQLAHYLFGVQVRIFGNAQWSRDDMGWQLESFEIERFETLDDRPLSLVVEELRSIQGNGWMKLDHPWEALGDLRSEP